MSTILRAVHNFTSENEDEITFNVNDLIEVVERGDLYSDGWWQGKVLPDGPVGLFPSAFTAPCDAVQALYDFHAEHKDELTFYAGDVIYVLEEDGPFGDDWWKVRLM
ncbi:hypothetical protein FRB95_004562 [Tulasnella sp. JGI-2019a]|nr:hypothetical protein FRB95_004562 [Tulasnella sp. JGI-2019a]